MIGDLNDCSILDVGCGFGDLYGYLSEQGIRVDYTGVDINRNFIRTAKEIYPDAHFIEADFEEALIRGKYDWSFASGIFNLKIDDNRSFIENTLRKMFKLSKRGLAADFLDAGLAMKGWGLYYQDPQAMLDLCNEFSDHVLMRHDYLPSDFCVYVYKGDEPVSLLFDDDR